MSFNLSKYKIKKEAQCIRKRISKIIFNAYKYKIKKLQTAYEKNSREFPSIDSCAYFNSQKHKIQIKYGLRNNNSMERSLIYPKHTAYDKNLRACFLSSYKLNITANTQVSYNFKSTI